MKPLIAFGLFLTSLAVGLTWLAGGNLSRTDLLNPVSSAASARRTDAETLVYTRESDLRLRHVELGLAEERDFQRAAHALSLDQARRQAERQDRESAAWLVIAAIAVWLPALSLSFYLFSRGRAALEQARASR